MDGLRYYCQQLTSVDVKEAASLIEGEEDSLLSPPLARHGQAAWNIARYGVCNTARQSAMVA